MTVLSCLVSGNPSGNPSTHLRKADGQGPPNPSAACCKQQIGGGSPSPTGTLTQKARRARRARPPSDRIAVGRRARVAHCRHCGARLLVGPDHDRCAYLARVDIASVDELQELLAVLSGRASYILRRGELWHREPHHHPGTPSAEPIYVEHRCSA